MIKIDQYLMKTHGNFGKKRLLSNSVYSYFLERYD